MIMITLTLLTFLAGVLADYVISRTIRRKPKSVAAEDEAVPPATTGAAAQAQVSAAYIEGFLMPEGLRYHAGHTWVHREQPNTARAGVDEFAARLAGHVDTIELPQLRQFVRQGQPIFRIHRKGETATLLSPLEGEVIEVNPDVVHDPSLLRSDPYGKGWLITLRCDEVSTWRNLLPVNLVGSWMNDTVSRLHAKQFSLTGVPAERGRPVDDLLGAAPWADWSGITAEFFLP